MLPDARDGRPPWQLARAVPDLTAQVNPAAFEGR